MHQHSSRSGSVPTWQQLLQQAQYFQQQSRRRARSKRRKSRRGSSHRRLAGGQSTATNHIITLFPHRKSKASKFIPFLIVEIVGLDIMIMCSHDWVKGIVSLKGQWVIFLSPYNKIERLRPFP